jgi:hypothetical protein
MRTTVDIDTPVLKDLKKIQKKEGKSLGRIISDLLAQALGERKSAKASTKPPNWISKRMVARIDLDVHHDRDFLKFSFLDVRDPLAGCATKT